MEKIYIGMVNYASADPAELLAAAQLDAAEQDRYDKIRHPQARASFLAGRALVRQLALAHGKIAPGALRIEAGANGKPVLAEPANHHISISHSHGLACAAWGPAAIGLDIEFHRPSRQWPDIAKRYFGPTENDCLAQAGDRGAQLFHDIWTLKEAWLKLGGQGLGGIAHSPQFWPKSTPLGVTLPTSLAETPLAGFTAFIFYNWKLRNRDGALYSLALASVGQTNQAQVEPELDLSALGSGWELGEYRQSGWIINSGLSGESAVY